MTIFVIVFFATFYLLSAIAIVIKLRSIMTKSNTVKVELYDVKEYSTNLENIYAGRLADTSVRSSVRYHKSLYKTNDDYEKYRARIKALKFP